MPNGYTGNIARVDLTDGQIRFEHPDRCFYRRYFGGRNVIAYYLLNEVGPDVAPLNSQNKLVFATGIITAAPVSGSGRNSVGARSPLTGGFGESEAGGFWGAELKRAGFDALIVEGRALAPAYLWVHDGEIEIREASHLWGKTVGMSARILQEELGDSELRTALIGPAGENQVRYACILNDLRHAYGRTGMGAVMGSKRLKAVAVRGKHPLTFADPERLNKLLAWTNANLPQGLQEMGTGGNLLALNAEGGLPTRNFQEGQFEKAQAISGQTMRETMLVRNQGCYACAVACKRVVQTEDDLHPVDTAYGGPEYETLAAMGSNCGVSDLAAIAKANELCNAYSLDTISAGNTIGFAMECFERGLLTPNDTDGLNLQFGNAEAMAPMIERIAHRQGIGDLLAEGVMRAASQIGRGAEAFALHVKGQEIPMHEPRYKQGMGMGYAVSPTGADHMQSIHDTGYTSGPAQLEALGILEASPAQTLDTAKVRMFVYQQHWNSFNNAAGLCVFAGLDYHQKAELVRAITGWNTTTWELMKVGERGTTLARTYNVRCGLTSSDDALPKRFHKAFTRGPLKGVRVDEGQLKRAIRDYYLMMGWTEEGVPTLIKLAELDVAWAANLIPL